MLNIETEDVTNNVNFIDLIVFVDFNVIQLKKTEVERGLSNAKSRNIVQVHGEEIPYFESSDPVIVEW